MTETAHALVAGAIASHINDPMTATSLSFLSHYVMDAVPHWDFGTNWRNRPKLKTGIFALADTLIGIVLALFLFAGRAPFPTLLLCITVSFLPDWIETPWYIFFAHPKKKTPSQRSGFWEKLAYRIYKTENFFHHKTKFAIGMITQIVTVGFFLFLLK